MTACWLCELGEGLIYFLQGNKPAVALFDGVESVARSNGFPEMLGVAAAKSCGCGGDRYELISGLRVVVHFEVY